MAQQPLSSAPQPVADAADDQQPTEPQPTGFSAPTTAQPASIKAHQSRNSFNFLLCVCRADLLPISRHDRVHNDITQHISMQVLGVGGGGSNAVNRMTFSELQGVEFWIINTDSQVSRRL